MLKKLFLVTTGYQARRCATTYRYHVYNHCNRLLTARNNNKNLSVLCSIFVLNKSVSLQLRAGLCQRAVCRANAVAATTRHRNLWSTLLVINMETKQNPQMVNNLLSGWQVYCISKKYFSIAMNIHTRTRDTRQHLHRTL